jgi:hypothetical protein
MRQARQQTSRRQTANSKQQTADSRKQATDSRQQAADSRQQTAGSSRASLPWLGALFRLPERLMEQRDVLCLLLCMLCLRLLLNGLPMGEGVFASVSSGVG